nr:EOG090X0KZ2 [Cyclestheria hislopi]
MNSDEKVGDLESEARKRKRKIEEMRKMLENAKQPVRDNSDAAQLPKPVFRSYKPQDKELQKASVVEASPANVDVDIQKTLSQATVSPILEDLDLANLAPRKCDWDLKRDVAKKLTKLEKKTQRAIALLIRERLSQTKQDLAVAVSAAETVSAWNPGE